jgi:hypothetical protein
MAQDDLAIARFPIRLANVDHLGRTHELLLLDFEQAASLFRIAELIDIKPKSWRSYATCLKSVRLGRSSYGYGNGVSKIR